MARVVPQNTRRREKCAFLRLKWRWFVRSAGRPGPQRLRSGVASKPSQAHRSIKALRAGNGPRSVGSGFDTQALVVKTT